jgi:hypothetical protein
MILPLVALLSLVAAPPVSAASPIDLGPLGPQRPVVVGDRLPRALELLATESGVVVPMQTGAFAVGRAAAFVTRLRQRSSSSFFFIDGPLRRSVAEDAALDFGLRSFALVEHEQVALQLSPSLALEVAGRSTPVEAGLAWEVPARERWPVAGIDAQATWSLVDDVVLLARATTELRPDPTLLQGVGAPTATSNVVAPAMIDVRFPRRATIGVAGPGFSLHVGRDRLELGNGRQGNLLLGDTTDFFDHVRAEVYLPAFTWTSLVLRLDPTLLPDETTLPGMSALEASQKHLVVHRLEGVVLEKLHLAVTEGWMVGGVPLDLRHLNPLLIFHNEFAWNDVDTYRSASMMVSLEATLSPVRGLRLWGQYAINQIQSPVERLWYPQAASDIADATAFLAGAEVSLPVPIWSSSLPLRAPWSSWSKVTGVAHVFAGLELAQADPFFGLRENPLTTWATRQRIPSNVTGQTELVEAPIGWRLGPDSRSLRLWVGALDIGLGELELGLEHRLIGEQTLRSPYREGADVVALRTPTGTPQSTRAFTAHLELVPLRLERFSATVRVDYRRLVTESLQHRRGVDVVDDQLLMGVRLDL